MYTHGKHTPKHTHTHTSFILSPALSLSLRYIYKTTMNRTSWKRTTAVFLDPTVTMNASATVTVVISLQARGECVKKDEQNKRTENKRLKTISSSRCRCHAAHRMFVPRKKKKHSGRRDEKTRPAEANADITLHPLAGRRAHQRGPPVRTSGTHPQTPPKWILT
ncbi:unnamed protein product [Arctogadus glacialis]